MSDVLWSNWSWFIITFIHSFHNEITAAFTFVIGVFTAALAVIACRQVKDSRILQRAYINVKPVGIYMSRNRAEGVAHIEICNAGNLPATNTKWFIEHTFCDDGDWEIGTINPRNRVSGSNVIAPKSKMRQGGKPILVGPAGLQHQEGLFLYIWGAVTYHDGFRGNRITTFCHRYNCANVTDNLKWGELAMSGLTARDHRLGNRTT